MNKTSITTAVRITLLLATLGTPWVAHATSTAQFPVQLAVGDYRREYVVGWNDWTSGDQMLNLAPGTYSFSNLTSSFTFDVRSDGTVVSNSPASATASGNTLTLQTVAITVNPGLYTRLYQAYGGQQVSGNQEIVSIVGLEDSLIGPAETQLASFTAGADGSILLLSGIDSVEASNGIIQFRNVAYTINSGIYGRPFSPFGGQWVTGIASVVGIPGATDGISSAMTSEIARFTLDANGTIHLISGEEGVQTATAELTFNTVSLTVDPRAWPRLYAPTGATQRQGLSQLIAIPGVVDQITTLSYQKIVEFTADSTGAIQVMTGANNVQIKSGMIVFNNVSISIKTENFSDGYDFVSGTRHFGAQKEVLIPFVSEVFELPNQPGQTSTVAVDDSGILINGEPMSPASISPAQGRSIQFSLIRANSVTAASNAAAPTASNESPAKEDSAAESSGGGCVPAAHASEGRGPVKTNLADLFTSPIGIALAFALVRRVRRFRSARL